MGHPPAVTFPPTRFGTKPQPRYFSVSQVLSTFGPRLQTWADDLTSAVGFNGIDGHTQVPRPYCSSCFLTINCSFLLLDHDQIAKHFVSI